MQWTCQWPRVITLMTIIIEKPSNKLLSNLQRAFSLSPGVHDLVKEAELDDAYSRWADEEVRQDLSDESQLRSAGQGVPERK